MSIEIELHSALESLNNHRSWLHRELNDVNVRIREAEDDLRKLTGVRTFKARNSSGSKTVTVEAYSLSAARGEAAKLLDPDKIYTIHEVK